MYIFYLKIEYFLQEVDFAHFWLYKVPLQLFGLIVNEDDNPFKGEFDECTRVVKRLQFH